MFQAVQKAPVNTEQMSAESWVLVITVLLIMLATAWYVIGRLRGMYFSTIAEPGSYLGTFQELREQGVLEEEEYKKLKETLSGDRTLTNPSIRKPVSKPAASPMSNEPEVEFEAVSGPEWNQPDTEE